MEALLSEIDLIEPARFCVANVETSAKLKLIIKAIYQQAVKLQSKAIGLLQDLIIDDVDEETIWEELQTRNRPLLRLLDRYSKSLVQQQKLSAIKSTSKATKAVKSKQHKPVVSEEENVDESDNEYDEDSGDDDGKLLQLRQRKTSRKTETDDGDDNEMMQDDEDEEDGDFDDEEEEQLDEADYDPARGELDSDQEMQMEAWLDAAEELEEKHRENEEKRERRAKASTVDNGGWDEEEEKEDDDLDFVQQAMYENDAEDDDEDDEGNQLDPSRIKYKDFFTDKPVARHNNNHSMKMQVDEDGFGDFDEDGDEDEDGEDDYGDEDDEEEERPKQRSSSSSNQTSNNSNKVSPPTKNNNNAFAKSFESAYQRRRRELAEQIKELEAELLAERSWELRGEVKAGERPENSLLDMAVDAERASKVAPVVSQEFTEGIEDMILRRVKDEKFNDPAALTRRNEVSISQKDVSAAASAEDPLSLSAEKGRQGLGEVYAEEYAKKVLNSDDALAVQTSALREEATSLFNTVARHLDALCHFYFTPRPVSGESSAKVLATQRSLPALQLEDIAPFTVSSTGTNVAPEQVQGKSKVPTIMKMTSAELGRDDRRKLRRTKKALGRTKKRQQEAEAGPEAKRARREAETLSKDKRVKVHASGDGKQQRQAQKSSSNSGGEDAAFSSAAFFGKLQREAETTVRGGSSSKQNRKSFGENKTKQAAEFKL